MRVQQRRKYDWLLNVMCSLLGRGSAGLLIILKVTTTKSPAHYEIMVK